MHQRLKITQIPSGENIFIKILCIEATVSGDCIKYKDNKSVHTPEDIPYKYNFVT